jgi:hypothetical protein
MNEHHAGYYGWAEAKHDGVPTSYGWSIQTMNLNTVFLPPCPGKKHAMDLRGRPGDGEDVLSLQYIADGRSSWMPITEEQAMAFARHLIFAVRANREARGS